MPPSSFSSQIHILPASESDLPTFARVFLSAFENDPLVGRLKAGLAPPIRYEETLRYFRRLWGERERYGGVWLKAVEGGDGDGEGKGKERYVDFFFRGFLGLR